MNKLLIFICLVLAVLCFVLFRGGKAVVRDMERDRIIVKGETELNIAALKRQKSALEKEIRKLTDERDAAEAALRAASELLELQGKGETVELSLLKDKLIEVEKRLEHAKQDRDNLANRLADVKAERDAAVEEFVRVLDRCEKLEAAIEAKDDAIQRLGGDVNCLREELEKAKSCVKCHQNHSNHRRHR